jgi:hypothetical protein
MHFVGQHLPLVGQAYSQVLTREARVVERHAEKVAGRLQQRSHRIRHRMLGFEHQIQHAYRNVPVAQRHRDDMLADGPQEIRRELLVVAAGFVPDALALRVARFRTRVAPRRTRVGAGAVFGTGNAHRDDWFVAHSVRRDHPHRARIGVCEAHDCREHRFNESFELCRGLDAHGRRASQVPVRKRRLGRDGRRVCRKRNRGA